jgi:hypothetical protein
MVEDSGWEAYVWHMAEYTFQAAVVEHPGPRIGAVPFH